MFKQKQMTKMFLQMQNQKQKSFHGNGQKFCNKNTIGKKFLKNLNPKPKTENVFATANQIKNKKFLTEKLTNRKT